METPGFHYFFLYRPKSALGLVGLVGWLGAALGSFCSAGSFRSFHQGLRSGGSGLARPASLCCWEMEKIRPSPSVLDEAERVPLPFGVVLDKIEKNKPPKGRLP